MRLRCLLTCLAGCGVLAGATLGWAADWRQFRGPAFGTTVEANPPQAWSVPEKQNIAWQADLPGRGPSSPIVVGDRVIVTASDGATQDQLYVLCFDLESGQELWRRRFWATGRTACHPSSGNAAPTPASDGQRIFAFYSSNDLICLDLAGNLLWYRGLAYDYPKAGNDVGMSSSPVVVAGVVVVQIENQGDSFAAGIDAATGETRWRVEREPAATWTSPVAGSGDQGGRPTVLLQSASVITAHDVATGAELWRVPQSCDLIPSPILAQRRAYFVASDRMMAVDVSTDGKSVSNVWDSTKLRPGAASPVIHEDRLYIINRAGVLNCADTATGELVWQLRLKGEFWASPFVVGQHMYLFNQEGEGLVVRLGDAAGEVVATNAIGEKIQASPAVSGGSIIVRSDRHLWRIAEGK